jgi:hypothetical protein
VPLPALLAEDGRGRIDRAELFSMAAASPSSPEELLNFYVGICAWGTGTKAQRVARVIKPLNQPGLLEALGRSFKASRNSNPIEAFRRLNTDGEDRVKGFGPAFFTKWLYFAAYDVLKDSGQEVPLILDDKVSKALGWPPITGRRTSGEYRKYLDVATEINTEWCPSEPLHVVEYALFKLGGGGS